MEDLLNVLKDKAKKHPHHEAILYLENGEHETARLNFGELCQYARAIGAVLQSRNMAGRHLLLIFPTGIDFVAALMGCWYAGAVAVPVPCPKAGEFEKQQDWLHTIMDDAEIAAILCPHACRTSLQKVLKKHTLIATDRIPRKKAENYREHTVTPEAIACLQYTSGSTFAPKAAVIGHGNLTASLKNTIKAWRYDQRSVTLTWAPHTHIYGLVCGLLVPLYHPNFP